MSFKPFLIAPMVTGLEKDKESWLLPNDAFPELTDAYLYQGRIHRRIGNMQLGRLRMEIDPMAPRALGNTAASPFIIANVFATLGLGPYASIVPGTIAVNIAAPVGPSTYLETVALDGTLTDGVNTGTINYTTGALSLNHGAGGPSAVTISFAYYPGLPVMGLPLRELATLNREGLIAFDTRKAYEWNSATNIFDDISFDTVGNPIQWTGTNIDFFWSWNYYRDSTFNKLFWTTNNVQNSVSGLGIVQNGIQVYNGTGWALQTPQLNSLAANRFLNGCLILIAYRDRMVALNTLESVLAVGAVAVRYPNRARWSQNGTPYTNTLGGFDVTAWYDTQPGKGGYIDAPTSEQIVSCGFFKDVLVVFFERSTWQLVYTGNDALPFYWQRINTEMGCESTFSTVGLDQGIFAVGDKAIVVSDAVNVERIDQKIPLEVFNLHNADDGKKRVYGIRDYYYQFVYWTMSLNNKSYQQYSTFPNKLLVLNYLEGSYSFYNDSYTCLGYFQRSADLNWLTMPGNWLTAPGNWLSGLYQADFPSVVAGNQQGYVMILDQKIDNDPTLTIRGITQANPCTITSYSHNLLEGQYVLISGVQGMTEINNLVGKVLSTTTADTFQLDIPTTGFTAYTQLGFITVLNTIEVISKKFNPFINEGKKVRMNYLDFFVERTPSGSFALDVFVDDSGSAPIDTQIISTVKNYGPLISVDKIWQRAYFDVMGQFLQFKIYLNDSQIRSSAYLKLPPIQEDIVIHAFNLWMAPSGRLQSYDIL